MNRKYLAIILLLSAVLGPVRAETVRVRALPGRASAVQPAPKSRGRKAPVRPHPLGEKVASPDLVKPYGEPHFLGQSAGWQLHTPSTTQWLLNAIEVMEWARNYQPE